MGTDALVDRVARAMEQRGLASADTPVLLMVSGGSDSTALAYVAHELRGRGALRHVAMLHVNHLLRGADADADERFVARLAGALGLELDSRRVDVGALAEATGGNLEALARAERYEAAREALDELCRRVGAPPSAGRILTAHTADDRVESFYMRSIVGTGPGGFRSMRYLNDRVARPLLDESREALRAYVAGCERDGKPMARDDAGALWREDATNAHTDRFRSYVRHEIVPLAKRRNPQLLSVLGRSMNLIADEDDMLEGMVDDLEGECATWDGPACVLAPSLGAVPVPLQRRLVVRVLRALLGPEARVQTRSVEAVLAAWDEGAVRGGYVTNIEGDLAVSANKRGVRVEPMAAFRARRGRC